MPSKDLVGKKALFVIAFKQFRDEEYTDTRQALEDRGVEITVASSARGQAQGMLGKIVEVDKLLGEVKAEDYDAVVFIGGVGAAAYLRNPQAHWLAQEAVSKEKILAAICIAPEILAQADVLRGKKATVWSSKTDRSPIEILERGGAEYVDQDVVLDGKIVTGNGPASAKKFGQTIADLLSK